MTKASVPHRGEVGVLVIGESVIDVVTREGVAVEMPGGSPANVALGLGRLGHRARFHTSIGPDARGTRIAEHLAGSGVIVTDESWTLQRTSVATARVRADGSAEYIFEIDGTIAAPRRRDEAVVHFGSISMFMHPGASTIEAFIEDLPRDVLVSMDPNIRPALVGPRDAAVRRFERLLQRADVVKLSDEDAAWLYPGASSGEVLDHLLRGSTRLVAITRGSGGAALATPTARVALDAPFVLVADTIGAGDTFMAALLNVVTRDDSVLRNLSSEGLRSVGEAATRAAAITVQREGADLPWADELLA